VAYKELILIRGLPGSGKSTFAQLISEGGKYQVFSIDQYFTNKEGNYQFDYKQNHLAYKNCEELAEKSMQKEASKVIIDNTFTLEWEMDPYLKLAQTYNYRVHVITVENYHNGKNIHGISSEQIEKMAAKYKVKLF